MQYDMARFEQPLVDETQPKAQVWTDIGDAEVEYSIFGKAKVRVYRQKDEVRGTLRWTLLAMGLIVAAVWLVSDAARQPAIVHVAAPKSAVEVVVPDVQKPVRVATPVKPRIVPHTSDTASQLPVTSAPVAANPLPRAPVGVSGVSAPVVVVQPVPSAAKPLSAPVRPVVPAAISSEAMQRPVEATSAVQASD
jgi:hypothetical protein